MHPVFPYLRLCRLPAVFSAAADVLLGWFLTHPDLSRSGPLPWLVAASCGLYLSGMTFNDVFDRELDARERPERPIPRGDVSLGNAVLFGSVLMFGGVAASIPAGGAALPVAVLLAALILTYDGLLKSTWLGPAAMGGCRALNILLGASAAGTWTELWQPPQTFAAAAMGTYVAGVTLFARNEAGTSRRIDLWGGIVVINVGLALAAAFVSLVDGAARDRTALVAVLVIVAVINRRLAFALQRPEPRLVQTAVRTMLLSLVTLDAAMIFHLTASPGTTFAVLLLLVPARMLGRWINTT